MTTMATEVLAYGAGWGPGAWWPIFPLFWVLFWGVVVFAVLRFWRSRARGTRADRVRGS